MTRIFKSKIEIWDTNMQTKAMFWVNSRLERVRNKLKNESIRLHNRKNKDKQEVQRVRRCNIRPTRVSEGENIKRIENFPKLKKECNFQFRNLNET